MVCAHLGLGVKVDRPTESKQAPLGASSTFTDVETASAAYQQAVHSAVEQVVSTNSYLQRAAVIAEEFRQAGGVDKAIAVVLEACGRGAV